MTSQTAARGIVQRLRKITPRQAAEQIHGLYYRPHCVMRVGIDYSYASPSLVVHEGGSSTPVAYFIPQRRREERLDVHLLRQPRPALDQAAEPNPLVEDTAANATASTAADTTVSTTIDAGAAASTTSDVVHAAARVPSPRPVGSEPGEEGPAILQVRALTPLRLPKLDPIARNHRLAALVVHAIEQHRLQAGLTQSQVQVVLEGYALGYGGFSSLSHLHEAGGVLKDHLYVQGYAVELISPLQIKHAFTGSGKAKKRDMLRAWHERFALPDLYLALGSPQPFDWTEPSTEVSKPTEDIVDAWALLTILHPVWHRVGLRRDLDQPPPPPRRRPRRLLTPAASPDSL